MKFNFLYAIIFCERKYEEMKVLENKEESISRYSILKKQKQNQMYINGLEINKWNHICILHNKDIFLTPLEFEILWYLLENRGRVVPARELFENVWQEKYLGCNNTIMVHIRRIRKKLGENTKKPKFIKTVWGVGYKIDR